MISKRNAVFFCVKRRLTLFKLPFQHRQFILKISLR